MLISARVPKVNAHDLLNAIRHRFDEIESELDELTQLRDKPGGTVRIACGDHILRTTILPKLAPLLREYPHIKMEFDVNYGFRDIVADRFDAGARLGATIDKHDSRAHRATVTHDDCRVARILRRLPKTEGTT